MLTKTTGKSIVSRYIERLNLPDMANVILQTQEQCEEFVHKYQYNHYQVDNLLDYREDLIKNSKINVDDFINMCYDIECGMKKAFELTFLQVFAQEHIDHINNLVVSGNLDLANLFNEFHEDIDVNIMKLI